MRFILVNCKNVDEHLAELEEFRDNIYNHAFPDDNEREPFDDKILPRIRSGNWLRTTILLAFDNGIMVGGEIADLYPSCESIHITYLAVAENMRGKGYGRRILKDGTALICQSFECEGNEIRHIFFETENDHTLIADARLRFYSHFNAGIIPIYYTQPPLSDYQDWVSNLCLCLLPLTKSDVGYIIGESRETQISADVVCEFLCRFYDVLGYCDKGKTELQRSICELSLITSLEGYVQIKRILGGIIHNS